MARYGALRRRYGRTLGATQADYIARLEWNIRDATEALTNAVAMGAWANVRKYTLQLEKLQRQKFLATSGPRGAVQRRVADMPGGYVPYGQVAGAVFGRGKLP